MLYLDTAIKLIIGLAALLAVTRILGRKEMAQITPFDIVYAIMLGGLLEESLYDEKISIGQMLFGIALWGVLIYLIEFLAARNAKARKLLKGDPSIIIKNGYLDMKTMKKNRLEMEQLRTMLRQNGIFSLREVRDLYLESGGTVSINKYANTEPPTADMLKMHVKDTAPSHLLVDEGYVKERNVANAGKTVEWVYEELEKEGYPDIKDIFVAEWSETDGFFIKTYGECNGK